MLGPTVLLLLLLRQLLAAQFPVPLVLRGTDPLQKLLPCQEPVLVVQHQLVVEPGAVDVAGPVELRLLQRRQLGPQPA